jgi:hypothetical protein
MVHDHVTHTLALIIKASFVCCALAEAITLQSNESDQLGIIHIYYGIWLCVSHIDYTKS